MQPFAPLRGTIFPPGQKLGEGGERTGHDTQQPTPMPPPQDTFVASAQWPSLHDDGERPTQAPPADAHVFFFPAFTSESTEPVSAPSAGAGSSAVAPLHAVTTGRRTASERTKEESACFMLP